MATYKTPGVYVEEISNLPVSVGQVSSAIPVFIGYTKNSNLIGEPTRINSLLEYTNLFGGAPTENFTVTVDGVTNMPVSVAFTTSVSEFKMYHSVQLYFLNGGGPCYIISVGDYSDPFSFTAIQGGLSPLEKEDQPTLILFPDLTSPTFSAVNAYGVYTAALAHCAKFKNRFLIIDTQENSDTAGGFHGDFRTNIGNQNLKYGAAYFPWLDTELKYGFDPATSVVLSHPGVLNGLYLNDPILSSQFVNSALALLNSVVVKLPPGGAVAGAYAINDQLNGVWKSPANILLKGVLKPVVKITDLIQEDMNIHTSGKSINAIRNFSGKGITIWGARTLAGNDNEWRYISVTRLFCNVEESLKKTSEFVIFEPNEQVTWVRLKGFISGFLNDLWRQGALAGGKPEDAYFVNVGLGLTMTSQDILEGRIIVEIGLAVVRPAEFIIFRFSHKQQT